MLNTNPFNPFNKDDHIQRATKLKLAMHLLESGYEVLPLLPSGSRVTLNQDKIINAESIHTYFYQYGHEVGTLIEGKLWWFKPQLSKNSRGMIPVSSFRFCEVENEIA